MTDYISREDALNFEMEIEADPEEIQAISKGMALYGEYIKSIPAAEVVERKTGVYSAKIFTPDKNPLFDAPLVSFWCLECDYTDKIIADRLTYKFCPNCGAWMRGDSDV